jgi:Serpin (serine protease inhibitor)
VAELGAYYERMRPSVYACTEARKAFARSFVPDIPWPFTGLKLVVPPLNTLAFGSLPRWARRMYGAPGSPVTDLSTTVTLRAMHQAATRIPKQLLGVPVPEASGLNRNNRRGNRQPSLPRPKAMRKARWNTALAPIVAASLAAGLVAGCATARPAHRGHAQKPAVLTASEVTTLRALSSGDAAFGLSLLSAVCHADPDRNVVLSPLSVTSGLGLAYLGARGGTAREMATVMHLPRVPASALTDDLRDRNELLGTLDRPGITFAETNRIWARR